jgi:hypothetical protein
MRGSSGSPVFNDRWYIIAVHKSGDDNAPKNYGSLTSAIVTELKKGNFVNSSSPAAMRAMVDVILSPPLLSSRESLSHVVSASTSSPLKSSVSQQGDRGTGGDDDNDGDLSLSSIAESISILYGSVTNNVTQRVIPSRNNTATNQSNVVDTRNDIDHNIGTSLILLLTGRV